MINVLGLHDDRDLHAELATVKREYDVTLARVAIGGFDQYETGWNTSARLSALHTQVHELTRLAAMEDQRIQRLADAISVVGDPVLGFIAYVALGIDALPVDAMYEVRIIQGGYGIGDGVRTNLPARRVETATRDLKAGVVRRHARLWDNDPDDYQVQVTAF